MPSSGHHRKTITYKIKSKHIFKQFSYICIKSHHPHCQKMSVLFPVIRQLSFPEHLVSGNLSCVSSFSACPRDSATRVYVQVLHSLL